MGVEVTFGTGTVVGEINADQIVLGNIVVDKQKFGEILDEIGDVFTDAKFSGILGLGYPGMAAYDAVPVFDSMINDKSLKRNIISFYYSYNENEEGEILIGDIDVSKFEGDLKYHDVIDQYYWTIKLDDVKYNGKSLGLCPPDGCRAVLDTGTTLITGPTDSLRTLLDTIPADNDCNNYDESGDITFVFNGSEYTLTKDEYIIKTTSFGYDSCRALMMPLDVPEPQ
jgi:hypothetical protein